MNIVCVGGVMDGHRVWNPRLEETVVLTDPHPVKRFVSAYPPMTVSRPVREFYNLERITSASNDVHYFYRHSALTLDEAMTLLLGRYKCDRGQGCT